MRDKPDMDAADLRRPSFPRGPPHRQHPPSPLFRRIQHIVFAAADARLQNLDASQALLSVI
jgi:hypothetical protein